MNDQRGSADNSWEDVDPYLYAMYFDHDSLIHPPFWFEPDARTDYQEIGRLLRDALAFLLRRFSGGARD